MKTALCIVIIGPTFQEAKCQIQKASKEADLLEFRIDLFKLDGFDDLAELFNFSILPVIFTLRGGSEKELLKLASLNPDFIDLDFETSKEVQSSIEGLAKGTKIILSMHFFLCTPANIEELADQLFEREADIYKISAFANSSIDALKILWLHVEAEKRGKKLAAMAMGEKGTPTRILGPIFKTAITYASLSDNTVSAPGQIAAIELLERYRFRGLTEATKIYALIGDPLHLSPSHVTHNFCFKELEENAVYLKLPLSKEELPFFLEYARKLRIRGCSVTMPLKESFEEKGPINTLLFGEESFLTLNSDGIGACLALEKLTLLKDKRIILLGAGGTAKAIVSALAERGASLIVLNRDIGKAKHFSCEFGALESFKEVAEKGYDILINTTPAGMNNEKEFPIPLEFLLENKIVFDAVIHKESALVKAAKRKNCQIITGYDLFIKQALHQFLFWGIDKSKRLKIEHSLTTALEHSFI